MRPFPEVQAGHWVVSAEGDSFRDGRRRATSCSVATLTGHTCRRYATFPESYHVSADGSRLVTLRDRDVDRVEIVMVDNWQGELTRLVPVD